MSPFSSNGAKFYTVPLNYQTFSHMGANVSTNISGTWPKFMGANVSTNIAGTWPKFMEIGCTPKYI